MMCPVELLPLAFAGISLIVLAAGFVQSLTGFGFAIVSVPFLVILLDPKVAVQVSLILGFVLSAALLPMSFRRGGASLQYPLMLGGLVGISLGSLLLGSVDSLTLRMLMGLAGVVLGILILRGLALRVRRKSLASALVGVISGALNSTTSYGGIPVALYLTTQGSDKTNLRTNMLTYLLLANLVTLLVMVTSGLLSSSTIVLSLKLVPALLAGIGLGAWAFPRVNPGKFSRIVLFVVLVASAMAFISAVYSYLQR